MQPTISPLVGAPGGQLFNNSRRGFYFTISSKLSNLFDLFGTSKSGLGGEQSHDEEEEE